nr:hypothetical protein [Tanacetum cinerariifolium]
GNVKRDVEEIETLNIELDHKEKVLVTTSLKVQLDKLKGKAVLTEAISLNPVDPELLKVDVAPLVPKLRKNRTAHTDYIRHTLKEATTLREIVESERLHSPLNTSLVYACKYTKRIQELLMIIQQTCPCLNDIGTNIVTVTPKNNAKQIRYTAQVTKSESISVTTPPLTNLESNKPMLSSTRVNLVSSANGSLSQDNTKNNRIWRTQKKAKKNKVEDHLRTVKSSLNKESVVDTKSTSSVLNSVSNVNSDLKCASCNGCLFSDNHDACKQPARATIPTDPSDVKRTESEQLKIVLRRSRHETHISQQGGSSMDEGTGSIPGVLDVPSYDSEEEISWNSSDDEDVDDQIKGSDDKEGKKTDESDDDDDKEETIEIGEQEVTESDEGDDEATESDRESEDEEIREQEEESFDPIPRTPEDNEDDDNNEEDQGLRIGDEERIQEEEDAEELNRDVNINQGRGLQSDPQQESSSTSSFMTNLLNPITDPGLESLFTTGSTTLQDSIQRENDEFLKTIDENMKKIIKEQVKTQVKAQVTRILPRIEEAINAQLEAEVLTRSSHSLRTSYAVVADLSEMELKKILI